MLCSTNQGHVGTAQRLYRDVVHGQEDDGNLDHFAPFVSLTQLKAWLAIRRHASCKDYANVLKYGRPPNRVLNERCTQGRDSTQNDACDKVEPEIAFVSWLS